MELSYGILCDLTTGIWSVISTSDQHDLSSYLSLGMTYGPDISHDCSHDQRWLDRWLVIDSLVNEWQWLAQPGLLVTYCHTFVTNSFKKFKFNNLNFDHSHRSPVKINFWADEGYYPMRFISFGHGWEQYLHIIINFQYYDSTTRTITYFAVTWFFQLITK